MGSICTNNYQKDQNTETAENIPRNTILYRCSIGQLCKIDLINGFYKFHRGQALLLLTTQAHYQQCNSIKQICPDADMVFQTIRASRKILVKWNPENQSRLSHPQYKTVLICVMPQYKTEQADTYYKQFRNVVKEVIENHKDITIQFSPTVQGQHATPNQMLLALMFRQIVQIKNTSSVYFKNEVVKISLISSQKKMIYLIKYELLKTDGTKVVPCQQKQLAISNF